MEEYIFNDGKERKMRKYMWTGRATLRLLVFLAMLATIIGMISCGPDNNGNGGNGEDPVVVNNAPVAYVPFVVSSSFTLRSQVLIDMRYRFHGCDAGGAPTSVTGARDIDDDKLEYMVVCDWSVFNEDEEKVNGKWITFREDSTGEQVATVWLWIGHAGDTVLYPTIDPQSCGETPSPVVLTYSVRDGKGGMSSASVVLGTQ